MTHLQSNCMNQESAFIDPSLVCLPVGDCRIFLPHGTTEQRRLQDGEAPADGLRPPQQLSVRGAAPLAHLPRAGLHHQGVHETGPSAQDVTMFTMKH